MELNSCVIIRFLLSFVKLDSRSIGMSQMYQLKILLGVYQVGEVLILWSDNVEFAVAVLVLWYNIWKVGRSCAGFRSWTFRCIIRASVLVNECTIRGTSLFFGPKFLFTKLYQLCFTQNVMAFSVIEVLSKICNSITSMDESWTSWLCDMESDDYSFINQSEIKVDDGISTLASHHDITTVLEKENQQRSITIENNSTMGCSLERPCKFLKTCTSNYVNAEHIPQKKASSPTSYILSFDNTNPTPIDVETASKPGTKVVNHGMLLPSKNEPRLFTQEGKKKTNGSVTRSHHHADDHIIAERTRREKISQQLIALSTLIPDLKKMDKATVLDAAIKYVKHLEGQVKGLEEKSKRKSVEYVVVVKKNEECAKDEDVCVSSNSCEYAIKTNVSLPEVEARVSNKDVLIRIHCEKENASLVNIFREIEKLHLSVTDSSALSFGSSVLHLTIIAKMEEEMNMSMKEVTTKLRVGLCNLCSAAPCTAHR
ncbi:hypothetical protein RJT34_30886 [Clitoria ternatea]|uniref:BHLH domain-containing protein n=1 Tax=Clitoria ternatea TaxID=43366 RepID=A0AAN9EUD5_CLITE